MKQEESAAIVIGIWNLYQNNVNAGSGGIIDYYQSLQTKNKVSNKEHRKNRINSSEMSMTIRYREVTTLQYSDVLYDSFMIEKYRTIITRWRLSCHPLRIETGRYQRPALPRNERTCMICNILENEHHALFVCPAHTFIRLHYANILSSYTTVQSILHPNSTEDANTIGKYILEIEGNMKKLNMVFKH